MPPAYFTPRRPRPSFTSLYDQSRLELEKAVSAGADLIALQRARDGFAPMLAESRAAFCEQAGIDDPNPGRAA